MCFRFGAFDQPQRVPAGPVHPQQGGGRCLAVVRPPDVRDIAPARLAGQPQLEEVIGPRIDLLGVEEHLHFIGTRITAITAQQPQHVIPGTGEVHVIPQAIAPVSIRDHHGVAVPGRRSGLDHTHPVVHERLHHDHGNGHIAETSRDAIRMDRLGDDEQVGARPEVRLGGVVHDADIEPQPPHSFHKHTIIG